METVGRLESHAKDRGIVAVWKLSHVHLHCHLASSLKLLGGPLMVPKALEADGRDGAIDAGGLGKPASAASLLARRGVEVGVVDIAVVDPWTFLLRRQIR